MTCMLDMRTVLIGYFVSNLLASVILWEVWKRHGRRFAGLSHFLAFYLLQTAGILLISLRGAIPDLFSIVAANLLNVGGSGLLIYGLVRFFGRSPAWFTNVFLFSLFMIALTFFTYVVPDIRVRTVLLYSMLAAVAGQGAIIALKRRPENLRESVRPVGIVFLALLASHLYRIALMFLLPMPESLFDAQWPHAMAIMIDQMLAVAMAFTLGLMVDDRLRNEILAAEKSLKENEEILSETGRISRVGGWEFDPATGKGTWTAETARIHDLDPGSETSVSVGLRYYTEASRSRIEAAIAGALASGAAYDLELEMITAKGNRKWVRTIGRPVIRDGRVVQMRGSFQDITDRKTAEEALRESEERYRIVSENTYDWEYWIAPNRSIVYMSPSCERVAGYTAAEFAANPRLLDEIVLPEDRAIVARHRNDARTDASAPHESDFRIRTKAGGVRWISHVCVGIVRPDGTDLGIRATNRDVTERREAEAAIRDLARFPSENPNPVLRADRSGTLLYLNDAALRMLADLNLEPGKPVGDPVRALAIDAFSEGRQKTGDLRINDRVFSFSASPQLDAGYVNLYARDITDRFRAEAVTRELLDQAEKSRLALLNILEDEKKAEESVNALNERLNLLIKAVQEIASARDIHALAASVKTYARTLAGSDGSTFVLRDGDRCWYMDEDAIAPLWKGRKFPLSDCVSGWVMTHGEPAVIEDVYSDPRVPAEAYRPTFVKSLAIVPLRTTTSLGAIGNYWAAPHRATDMELNLTRTLADAAARAVENIRLVEDLESRVSERTAELETVNRELESFSYSVSHDLRSPLRGIDGWSHALIEDFGSVLGEKAREYLDRVRSETQRMGRLIDDLLQLSRISRNELRVVRLDLSAAAETVIRRLREAEPGRAVRIRVEPGIEADADAALLDILLTNLIGNAWKFTGRTPDAFIEFGRAGAETGNALFVRDNGAGFDMRYAAKLFAPFQRMHKQSEFQGTGIGLATVQRIVNRHGGVIRCESAPGRGAAFTFTLGGIHAKEGNARGEKTDHPSGGG
jgi:PAS domain S-box-containing protein